MITLVNGKGEQVNGFQFLDWDEAESYLSEQRKKGTGGLYLRGDFGTPIACNGVYFIVVGFGGDCGLEYSIAIKAKHLPCPEELMTWVKPDMDRFGYSEIFEYYVVDEGDVYMDYDPDNIDNWPVFGELSVD